MAIIHPTAVVAKGAFIEEGVTIGPYSIIGEKVKIKKGTSVGPHVVIDGDTEIGENNDIFPFVSIGLKPQDLKYNGEETKVIIGNNNRIGECATIHKGTTATWKTVIGNNNLFMAYAHVAHDCVVGSNCIMANSATLGGHVVLEDYAIIGGLTPVHQFVKIGCHAIIGGASAVNQDIAPFLMAEGNKAVTHGLNVVGLKRRGFSDEQIEVLKDVYKIIFRSKLILKNAIEQVKGKYPDDENVKHMVEFILQSERGICR